MEFTFSTLYDQNATTTMAKVLRKTLRKKRSRRSHLLGWIIVILGILLTLPFGPEKFVLDLRVIITWLCILVILIVLFAEDRLNGYIARKRMLPGTEKADSVFQEEGYQSCTEIGQTQWHYDKITLLAETPAYFVFVFSQNHAQIYDKASLEGGTLADFRTFIQEKTGKSILSIK